MLYGEKTVRITLFSIKTKKYIFLLFYWITAIILYNWYPFYTNSPESSIHPWSSNFVFFYLSILTVIFGLYTFYILYLQIGGILKWNTSLAFRGFWKRIVLLVSLLSIPIIVYVVVYLYTMAVLYYYKPLNLELVTSFFPGAVYELLFAAIIYLVSPMIFSFIVAYWIYGFKNLKKVLVYSFIYEVVALVVFIIGNLIGRSLDLLLTYLTGNPFSALVYFRGFNSGYYELLKTSRSSAELILKSIPSYGRLLSITIDSILLGRFLCWVIHRLGYK